jgi:GH15 family glucan-1,4-alpha-glucosidase
VGYPPIANHGVIGNMNTVALVGVDGTIDWLCFPFFDSPSVFASILDDRKGGAFRVAPAAGDVAGKQFYWPDTNVLVTRFLSPTGDGVGEVTDFMPVGVPVEDLGHHAVVRRVRVARGVMPFVAECRPAFDYARAAHAMALDARGAHFSTSQLRVTLRASVPLEPTEDGGVRASFVLKEGESAVFLLGRDLAEPRPGEHLTARAEGLFHTTVQYWRRWLSRCTYQGRWREIVSRSALVLKLLTFEPSGAIIAAATCSLPELIGGGRNWDYRYSWLRDAAFTIYGLIRIGFTDEAARFMSWLGGCYHQLESDGSLQVVYGIDGRHNLGEEILAHLDGYRGSRPVRVGNAAADQLQLDIYGEMMDAIYLFNKYGLPISYDGWTRVRRVLDWLADNWQRPDEGIWEVRGGRRPFVYSRLMCWVAFDRGLRLADKRSFPADRARWSAIRDRIYEEIMTQGWNPELQSFVQSYGSRSLDASLLIMPLVFFLSPSDPRMLQTLRAINRPPREGGLVSDGLVFRYDTETSADGVTGREGTFNLCTFWLVEALTRAGRAHPALLEEARLVFERMLGYANHLGLFSEETGPSGEALGNFPQAFTHLALISAAYNLDRALR